MHFAPMRSLQIRDIPDDVYQGVLAAARAEHRSLSQQAVVELRRGLRLAGVAQRSAETVALLRESGRRLPADAPEPEALIREIATIDERFRRS
ncbi:MAG: hypothetical protein R3E87_09080 [Burkholderiaceae bacterium]